ncbi:hypothetical protein GCM10028807_24050 [Spirosoma daeguense]
MKHLFIVILSFLNIVQVSAQIGFGGKPHPSAALDVPATNKAFYPPRMNSSERMSIINPQAGAFVYDTEKGTFYVFNGQSWSPLALATPNTLPPLTYTPSERAQGSQFGRSVAISGNYAIISSPTKWVGSNHDQGAAYVFTRNSSGWTQQAMLAAQDGASGDTFGQTAAIYGDYAIVGSHHSTVNGNEHQGAAYIFVRSGTTWTQQAKLVAEDGTADDWFGRKVAIYGDYAIVSADRQNTNGRNDQGAAYIFVRNGSTWTQQAKLIAEDGVANDSFGSSVSIYDNYALVGANSKNAVYIFVRNGAIWTQQTKLASPTSTSSEQFSFATDLKDNYAVVSKPAPFSPNIAEVYVYVRNGVNWSLQSTITYPDVANTGTTLPDYFGNSVSLSGNYLLVGAPGIDINGRPDQGVTYIFSRNGTSWNLLRKLSYTDDSTTPSEFGTGVSIENGTFIIGAPGSEGSRGRIKIGTID